MLIFSWKIGEENRVNENIRREDFRWSGNELREIHFFFYLLFESDRARYILILLFLWFSFRVILICKSKFLFKSTFHWFHHSFHTSSINFTWYKYIFKLEILYEIFKCYFFLKKVYLFWKTKVHWTLVFVVIVDYLYYFLI